MEVGTIVSTNTCLYGKITAVKDWPRPGVAKPKVSSASLIATLRSIGLGESEQRRPIESHVEEYREQMERAHYGLGWRPTDQHLYHVHYIDPNTGSLMACPDKRPHNDPFSCPICGTNVFIEDMREFSERDLEFYRKMGMIKDQEGGTECPSDSAPNAV